MNIDFVGIAAIITAVTGLCSVILTAVIILKVNHVVKLTNSNFSTMQQTLDTALEKNTEQQIAAVEAALAAPASRKDSP